jgi:hypothetical protein
VANRLQGAHPSGFEHDLGGSCLQLLPQAVQDRNALLGPEKPWISSQQEPPFRSGASVSPDDRHLPCLHLDHLSRGARHGLGVEQNHSPHRSMRSQPFPTRSAIARSFPQRRATYTGRLHASERGLKYVSGSEPLEGVALLQNVIDSSVQNGEKYLESTSLLESLIRE